ncbi:MAG: hypothetical protein QG610_1966 [Euryarchaeota archaeon]|nr:hypothetical protein [Euryarchaeota archaeon]
MTLSKKSELLLNQKQVFKKLILESFLSGDIDRETAISKLDISERQFIRIVNKYKHYGDSSLIHGLCNRISNHSSEQDVHDKVVNLYSTVYRDFNYVHASELLLELNNLNVHANTLRNWLLSSGITKPRRKKKSYFKHRTPRPKFGDMLQLDGSFHDWFGDGKQYCLMHLVDDATKTSLAMLFDGETTHAALIILYEWCKKYGIPGSIYSDRDSVYKVNDPHQVLTIEEELSGRTLPLTDFGKICDKLGIKQIFAYSPQGKGRVERKHQMYQDRMVKEIKLFNLKNMEEVNNFLLKENGFIAKLNRKFTIEAPGGNAVINMPEEQLFEYFTIDDTRIVRNDYTIQYKNQIMQLAKHLVIRAKAKVTVKTYLNGKIVVFAGKYKLTHTVLVNYQKPITVKPDLQKTDTIKSEAKKMTPWRTYTPKKSSSGRNKSQMQQGLDYLARMYE